MSITGFNRRRRLNAKRKTEQRNTSRPEAKMQQAEQTEQKEEKYEEMTYNELRVLAKEKADEKGIELSPTPKKQDCIDILRGE